MKLRFSWLILVLAIFVPFEVMILKYMPVSDSVYSYLRFAVEVIIYILAGTLLIRYVYLKKMPKGTSIDKPLLIFIAYAIIITIINNAPLLQSFMGLRVLLRYLPLFYLVALLNTSESTAKKIFVAIMVIAGVQCLLAVNQHFFGISQVWYPRASDLEIGGKQVSFRLLGSGFRSGRELGAGIGTFGDSVFLALFLVISFPLALASIQSSVALSSLRKLGYGLILGLITLALFYTYSRGSVLVALASIPIIYILSGSKKKLILVIIGGIILITPAIFSAIFQSSSSTTAYINPKIKYTDPLANITTVFSSSYVDNTMQFSRGMVLTEVGGNLLKSLKLMGYSPAQEFALDKAATRLFGSNMPVNNLPIINDVYWVAFIIYYGIFGLAVYLFILYRIFKASIFVYKNTNAVYFRIFALALAALVIIAIPYSFILRTFVFRAFGFYFWLIAGLVFSEWRRLKYANPDLVQQ